MARDSPPSPPCSLAARRSQSAGRTRRRGFTQQDFKKLIAAKNVIIVDTRNADAYAQGHIPGAILLPLEGRLTWSDERQKTVVEPLKRAKKPIVTYCA